MRMKKRPVSQEASATEQHDDNRNFAMTLIHPQNKIMQQWKLDETKATQEKENRDILPSLHHTSGQRRSSSSQNLDHSQHIGKIRACTKVPLRLRKMGTANALSHTRMHLHRILA
ncbi:hypothetical protein AVEN_14908-1 [Araneus ventricosus]|uniref:Uncharacterized protein n=1 Tax=Araneus ventricosus TaxID=182803 RepID=A0A4Y2M3T1_ARAVE|nr:hypothetical protein AVEN_14908-1 [Araneus ventricosus]